MDVKGCDCATTAAPELDSLASVSRVSSDFRTVRARVTRKFSKARADDHSKPRANGIASIHPENRPKASACRLRPRRGRPRPEQTQHLAPYVAGTHQPRVMIDINGSPSTNVTITLASSVEANDDAPLSRDVARQRQRSRRSGVDRHYPAFGQGSASSLGSLTHTSFRCIRVHANEARSASEDRVAAAPRSHTRSTRHILVVRANGKPFPIATSPTDEMIGWPESSIHQIIDAMRTNRESVRPKPLVFGDVVVGVAAKNEGLIVYSMQRARSLMNSSRLENPSLSRSALKSSESEESRPFANSQLSSMPSLSVSY